MPEVVIFPDEDSMFAAHENFDALIITTRRPDDNRPGGTRNWPPILPASDVPFFRRGYTHISDGKLSVMAIWEANMPEKFIMGT